MSSDRWEPVSLDSPLHRGPRSPVDAPVIGKLESLPFDLLTWENFERIQWRVMRDVLGLREAQIYGDRGQAQYGLDVVALAADSSGVALQSKKYSRFGPGELEAAVRKFVATRRPFAVGRLIIGVSREVKSTRAVEKLAELRRDNLPLELELWDNQELSRLLRKAPEIVIEFFGLPTAEAFCLPFELATTIVPSADVIAVREALARTPEEVTGARSLLVEAEGTEDPEQTLALIENAQKKLREAGFHGHAAQHESRRIELLANLGRADDAARQILDEFWIALDSGLTVTAQSARRRAAELARSEQRSCIDDLVAVADSAIRLYFNPLAQLPAPDSLAVGRPSDQAQLGVLAGEIALANDQVDWLIDAQPMLRSLRDETMMKPLLRTRLRLLIAESSDDWIEILDDARKLQLGHALGGLITARYARYCALRERFVEADILWDEAAGDACLAKCWVDASTWVFSRRAFRNRWKPFTGDQFLPMQTALREMGPARPIVRVDTRAYEHALEQLRQNNLRSAAISAQRALRDATVTSNWVGEGDARRVLAAILCASGEPDLAAHHLVRAADVKAIEELGRAQSMRFIDVTADLKAANYWTVGVAYRLIAAQADLVPDDLLAPIGDRVLGELAAMEAGELVDLQGFSVSRYLGAIGVLAGIGHRLTEAQAKRALAHFQQQPSVDLNHYRYHDENEALATARIASAHGGLRDDAVHHLVALLVRSQSARNETTREIVDRFVEIARGDLEIQASDGSRWAKEVLAFHDPSGVADEDAEDALNRLTTPLIHVPGIFTRGTGAIGDSLLILGMDAARLALAADELLCRAEDSHVGSGDRNDYLVAAANLAPELNLRDRRRIFSTAMKSVTSPTPSEHDDLDRGFAHELGSIRVRRPDSDSRNRAVYLAACLASDDHQRREVRSQAYALLGGGESDYWPTRSLQVLGTALREDVGFLAGQGWALRSLAAIVWCGQGGAVHLGLRLAEDEDVRVRRALARELGRTPPAESQALVRGRLERDPCHSVRTALAGADRRLGQ